MVDCIQRGDLIHGAFQENVSIYLVISHPCDILNAKELSIEMIGCKAIESDDPLLQNGRNPRIMTIHPLVDGEERLFSISQADKLSVEKTVLDAGNHVIEGYLPEKEKAILPHWLAVRYDRIELPNAIHDLIVKDLRIGDILKKSSFDDLFEIWISVDNLFDGEESSKFDYTSYFTSLIAVFHSDNQAENDAAERFVAAIEGKAVFKKMESNVSVQAVGSELIDLDFIERFQGFDYDWLSF